MDVPEAMFQQHHILLSSIDSIVISVFNNVNLWLLKRKMKHATKSPCYDYHNIFDVFSYLKIFLAIFITVVLPTFIAPFGQNSWQQKQWMQIFRLIAGFLSFMVIALAGQTWAHFPQPTHSLGSSFGNGVMTRAAKKSAIFPGIPSPSTWKKTLDWAGTVL